MSWFRRSGGVAVATPVVRHPLAPMARVSFPDRGTCGVCGRVDIIGRIAYCECNAESCTRFLVCASCTMEGRN